MTMERIPHLGRKKGRKGMELQGMPLTLFFLSRSGRKDEVKEGRFNSSMKICDFLLVTFLINQIGGSFPGTFCFPSLFPSDF